MTNKIMKALTFVFCLLALPLQMFAEGNEKEMSAEAERVANIIKANSEAEAEKQIADIVKANKKDAAFLTDVACAWFYGGLNADKAFKYVRRAIKADKKYSRAYVVAGEMSLSRYLLSDDVNQIAQPTDTVEALKWFAKGIKANREDGTCYSAYANLVAMSDTVEAEAKLQELLEVNPDAPISIYRGRMYRFLARTVEGKTHEAMQMKKRYPHLANHYQANMKNAVNAFAASDMNQFERNDFVYYALSCVAIGEFGKVVDVVCPAALTKYPNDAEFVRLAFDYATRIAKAAESLKAYKASKTWYGKALKYSDALLANEENDTLKVQDMYNIANANYICKSYNEAIAMAERLIASPLASNGARDSSYQMMINSYQQIAEYDKCIAKINDYNEYKKSQGTFAAADMERLANVYLARAEEVVNDTATQFGYYRQAIDVYEKMAQTFNDVDTQSYAYARVLRFNASMDMDYKSTKAYDSALRLVDFLEKQPADVREKYKSRLSFAYEYLATYSYVTNAGKKGRAMKTAGEYAVKALELAPDNRRAQIIYEATAKYLPKSLRKFDVK